MFMLRQMVKIPKLKRAHV